MSSLPANMMARGGQWKQRCGPSGLHLFDRASGLNILLDEVPVPANLWSSAPRQVSIALTNKCDLACKHCFAPKSRDELRYEEVAAWIIELDSNGCLGVGFGGGEPTLHPSFAELCQFTAIETRLAVTFTTHGHHVDERLADLLRGNVHFIRVSVDGVGATYESIRRRSFSTLKTRLGLIAEIAPFGINFVVNEQTLPDLDAAAALCEETGATELVLLPQIPVRLAPGIDEQTKHQLRAWVTRYRGRPRLAISETHADGFPTCEPLPDERGLRAYAHIDAGGILKATSFDGAGVEIGTGRGIDALGRLNRDLGKE